MTFDLLTMAGLARESQLSPTSVHRALESEASL
jgi:hypothetical protein